MQKEHCVARVYFTRHVQLIIHEEPVREHFAHCRYQLSHFLHSVFINAYCSEEPVPRGLKYINTEKTPKSTLIKQEVPV